jgi:hypothetical protein
MGGNQGRIRDMVSSAKEIWKDDPDVCDAWLKVVFNDSKTELNHGYALDEPPPNESRSCPERYLKCEKDGEYRTSLKNGKLTRNVGVSDAVVILRKNGLSYALLDGDSISSEGKIQYSRNKMPGGKVQTSDRVLAKESEKGFKEHHIAVLRECQEELPWPVYGILNGEWHEYVEEVEGNPRCLQVKSNESFAPVYVALHFDETPSADPSPESNQRFENITRKTKYWFSKAILVDPGNTIPPQSRVFSNSGNKKDVFGWMPITTNSVHMLNQKDICPERLVRNELPFGISPQLTPSPPLHAYALIESMTGSDDGQYGRKLKDLILKRIQQLAEPKEKGGTGKEYTDIITEVSKGTSLAARGQKELEKKLKPYKRTIVKAQGGHMETRRKVKGADRKESSYDLHNRHIQLLIHRLGNYSEKHNEGERDSKKYLGYSYRMRKRIQQSQILDELSALHSYTQFSKEKKPQTKRHIGEGKLSEYLFENWFGKDQVETDVDDVIQLFDSFSAKVVEDRKAHANGMVGMLSIHKKLYTTMKNLACSDCNVERGKPCPIEGRGNIPYRYGENRRLKPTKQLRIEMKAFYLTDSKLKDLKVDFSPTTTEENLYRAPFSCKNRYVDVSKRDVLVGTLAPLLRNEGTKTPHQFFGVQCPAPFTVQSNMYGSVSRTVQRMTWQMADNLSMKSKKEDENDQPLQKNDRLLWEFITRGKPIKTDPIDRVDVELKILSFKKQETDEDRFVLLDGDDDTKNALQTRPNMVLSPSSRKWSWKHEKPSSYLQNGVIIGEGKLPIISPDSSLREAIEIATSNGVGVAIGIDVWHLADDDNQKPIKSSRCLEDERWHIDDDLFHNDEKGIGARTFCGFLARLNEEKCLNIASKKVVQKRRIFGILLLEDMLD